MSAARYLIYGDMRSGNCQKVLWTAKLTHQEFTWNEIDAVDGATRTPEFLALNPAGQVPVLELSDGRILTESNAIMLYMAEVAASPLLPHDPFVRAQMMQWLFWEQYSHEPNIAVRRRLVHTLRTPEAAIDPQLLVKGRRALGRMEMALLGGDFLLDDAMTLADVSLVAYTRLAPQGGFDLSEFPAVQAWIARVERELPLEEAV